MNHVIKAKQNAYVKIIVELERTGMLLFQPHPSCVTLHAMGHVNLSLFALNPYKRLLNLIWKHKNNAHQINLTSTSQVTKPLILNLAQIGEKTTNVKFILAVLFNYLFFLNLQLNHSK